MAMEEDVIRRTTTPAYRAPEMWDLLSRKRIDTKVDIWVRFSRTNPYKHLLCSRVATTRRQDHTTH
jgi:hypothetical protein